MLSAGVVAGMPQDRRPNLERLARGSDLVLVARVESVAKSPGFWSGFISSIQVVNYKVVEVLKGEQDKRVFSVGFIIDPGNPYVDPKEPHVSASLFQPGHRQVLFLKRAPAEPDSGPAPAKSYAYEYLVPHDNVYLVPASGETLDTLRRVTSNR